MILPGQGQYYNPDFITPEGRVKLEGYTTSLIAENALSWLKVGRDADKPFMIMIQHKAPHRDWQAPLEHINDYRGEEIPEPETLFDDYANRSFVLKENEMEIARHMRLEFDLKIWRRGAPGKQFENGFLNRLDAEQRKAFEDAYQAENDAYLDQPLEGKAQSRYFYQRYIKDYLRCVASVDDSVGEVLKYLDDAGLAENTVVVYSSDQGFYLGEHGWYDKRWIFEESLRTPLLVRWPGVVKPGSTNKNLVSNLDFAESFLEMAGVDVPDDMQGRSLLPILTGKTPSDWRTQFYYHYYELGTHNVAAHEGVVTDRYKLVHYYRHLENGKPADIEEWDLMDRGKDPLELRSFIEEAEYADLKDELKRDLNRLRTELQVVD
jgi:arylsulfatase A-like enzyme